MLQAIPRLALLATLALLTSAPAIAQDAGDGYVRVAAARTSDVEKGGAVLNGVARLAGDHDAHASYHGVLTGGYFLTDGIAIEASVATPATSRIAPTASLGTLGNVDSTTVTLGANVEPIKGPISPFVGAGYARQIGLQARDRLGVDLTHRDAGGAYLQAGVDVAMSPRWTLFAAVRKAWYRNSVAGLLPTDATGIHFASIVADAGSDPVTVQLGVTARFGASADSADGTPIGTDASHWTIRAGVTGTSLANRVKLYVQGARYPGAGLSTRVHATPSVQIGYFLLPNIAVNVTMGLPPSVNIYGAGSIGTLPTLGTIRYGATVLTAQYHLTRHGRVRPYVGVGGSYAMVFNTRDGAFQNLKVSNNLGWAFEAGSDLMLSKRIGLFVDTKKALLRPTARGTFMGAPVMGHTRLDPWAFSGGIAFHI